MLGTMNVYHVTLKTGELLNLGLFGFVSKRRMLQGEEFQELQCTKNEREELSVVLTPF